MVSIKALDQRFSPLWDGAWVLAALFVLI